MALLAMGPDGSPTNHGDSMVFPTDTVFVPGQIQAEG